MKQSNKEKAIIIIASICLLGGVICGYNLAVIIGGGLLFFALLS